MEIYSAISTKPVNMVAASLIIFELVRMRKIKWHSSYTDSSTRERTNPCKIVARSKSNQRCSANSRSLFEPSSGTSLGPQSAYSRTDFTFDNDSERSFIKILFKIDVSFVGGSIVVNAVRAHWHNVPVGSSSSREKS